MVILALTSRTVSTRPAIVIDSRLHAVLLSFLTQKARLEISHPHNLAWCIANIATLHVFALFVPLGSLDDVLQLTQMLLLAPRKQC